MFIHINIFWSGSALRGDVGPPFLGAHHLQEGLKGSGAKGFWAFWVAAQGRDLGGSIVSCRS